MSSPRNVHLMANPLIMLNMSAEMMFILDQRLWAQNITPEKASKVASDLISYAFSKAILDHAMEQKPIHSLEEIKKIYEKIVDCSIMHLNESSFSKVAFLSFEKSLKWMDCWLVFKSLGCLKPFGSIGWR